ncbi:MAG: hypothetical protein RJB38_2085 [Pseudomonadota bacterium]|jgi:Undecaprenyl-phosphate glucose phosphotransferase
MLKRYHSHVGTTLRWHDAIMVGSVWLLSYYARFHLPLIAITKGIPEVSRYVAILPLVIVLWHVVFSSAGLYRSAQIMGRYQELFRVLQAHALAIVILLALSYLISDYRYSRATIGIFALLGALGLGLGRLTVRNLFRSRRLKGLGVTRTLLVGEGPSAELILGRLLRFPELGLQVVGRLISGNSPEPTSREFASIAVLGTFAELARILKDQQIEELIIALPRSQSDWLDRLLRQVRDETVDIRVIPDLHEYVTLGCLIEDFEGLPVVGLNESPLMGWSAKFKRLTDIVLSGFALIFLSPLLALIALAIRVTSPGPIFYRQERMGIDGSTFDMLKFRSMRVDAEDLSGPVWARQNDNRRTVLGSFLRSTSLDELPQFWNVLKGDMSLVGPRPERPVFVEKFRNEIPGYMLRHKVKAGITGWAQVNGWRGDTSLEKRIECDLYYIRHWSFWMDVKILWLTVWRGFVHKNAY